jgi:hypothetical protein
MPSLGSKVVRRFMKGDNDNVLPRNKSKLADLQTEDAHVGVTEDHMLDVDKQYLGKTNTAYGVPWKKHVIDTPGLEEQLTSEFKDLLRENDLRGLQEFLEAHTRMSWQQMRKQFGVGLRSMYGEYDV